MSPTVPFGGVQVFEPSVSAFEGPALSSESIKEIKAPTLETLVKSQHTKKSVPLVNKQASSLSKQSKKSKLKIKQKEETSSQDSRVSKRNKKKPPLAEEKEKKRGTIVI